MSTIHSTGSDMQTNVKRNIEGAPQRHTPSRRRKHNRRAASAPTVGVDGPPRLLPRASLIVWMLALTMIPVWIGVDVGATFPIQCIAALFAIVASINGAQFSINRFDAYFATFLIVSFCAVWWAGSSMALWLQLPIRWAIPYFAARILVSAAGISFTSKLIAIAFTAVGGLAVVELAFSWHPFVGWANSSLEFQNWSWIQERAGRDRSEWAFGHSIALGASLAMAVPFIFGAHYRPPATALMLGAIGAGTIASGSRAAMAAASLTALTCLLSKLRSPLERTAALLILTFVGFIAIPTFMPAFESFALSTTEQKTSFAYRGVLYSRYFSTIEWFGPSASRELITSTDSSILHLGLNFGWLVLLLATFPLVLIVFRVISGRASSADVAIFGQIPMFATTALITQYQIFVFFIAGIAVQIACQAQKSKNKPLLTSKIKPPVDSVIPIARNRRRKVNGVRSQAVPVHVRQH